MAGRVICTVKAHGECEFFIIITIIPVAADKAAAVVKM